MFLWINSGLQARATASVAALDRGLIYGDGVFDTMRVTGGKAVLSEPHINRLLQALETLQFAKRPEKELLEGAIAETISANQVQDGYLRLTVTRGPTGGFACELTSLLGYTLIIEVKSTGESGRKLWPPVCAHVCSILRNGTSPLTAIKSLHYMDNILGRAEAASHQCDEALFLNLAGHVAECASSNVFWVKNECLYTPALDGSLLPGITRQWVLQEAKSRAMSVCEGAFPVNDLLMADEAFLTNAYVGVRPLCKIDRAEIGGGQPGPVTRQMQAFYAHYLERF